MPRTVILPPQSEASAEGIKSGGWWHESEDGARVICDLCPRGCTLPEGKRGLCFVRQNLHGEMVTTTFNRSTGFCIDPIEKKPLNHFYPGTPVLSFGTAGCNLACKFCQNWEISKSREIDALGQWAEPETVAQAARQLGCQSVAFTYNDPVVWAEYAIECAKACRAAGVKTVAVTAGYINAPARETFFEEMDATNVDLKAFTEGFYKMVTGSHLAPVQETLKWLVHESNVWLEVTNLIIPGNNDSDDELKRMCAWLVEALGPNVPVHFTAFHPDFRMRDVPHTPPATLIKAHEIARAAGLNYAYTGNISDRARQSTYCPGCGQVLVGRDGYNLTAYNLRQDCCRACGLAIPGHFGDAPGDWGARRQPVRMAAYAPPRNTQPANGPQPKNSLLIVSQPLQEKDVNRPMIPASLSLPAAEETEKGCFEFSPDQERRILQAAAKHLIAVVHGQMPPPLETSLADLASLSVAGVFVTLKRSGSLRSCCGSLGQSMPLSQAIEQATVAVAKNDRRFPPISPVELPFLDMDVWLLGKSEPILAKGSQRQGAVVIGKHGLRIAKGSHSGLLLPGVAVEHHLDARAFLEKVCEKAGLPVNAWKDDDAVLMTFQGHAIEGELGQAVGREGGSENALQGVARPGPSKADVAMLADVCRQNLYALMIGATPAFYVPGAFDGAVQGIVLSLHLPGTAKRIDFSQLNLLGEMPLQSTLLEIAKGAAAVLRKRGLPTAAVASAALGLTILWDAAMHGSSDAPQLQGVDPAHRALLVAQQGQWSLAWNAQGGLEALLREAVELLPSTAGARGAIFSLAAASTADRLAASNVPKPQAGAEVRMSAVAGAFYPVNAEAIDGMLDQWLANKPQPEPWAAAMVPHAGWVYSGHLAAEVFSHVKFPRQVIVISPRHHPEGVAWAVAPHRTWQLPGRSLDSDPSLARTLVESISGLELDAAAHGREHGIEVQLPLIARLAPESRVVGITIHSGELADIERFGKQLAGVLAGLSERPLLVISSDMNHFADDSETRRLDRMALDALASLDPQRLYWTVRENRISMCGVLPAVVVLTALKHLNALSRCHEVGYTTSAAVSCDTERCVGYAGALFS